jgi:hypothetical protein
MASDTDSQGAWFEFRIEETEGRGVEAAKLSRLLQDLSSAFYAIARARLGKEATRPGRRTSDEDALAAIRIVRLTPGSAVLEADPPSIGLQPRLELSAESTPEDVLVDFALETQRLGRKERSAFARPEIRRRIRAVLRDAGEIGKVTEVVVRPRGAGHRVGLTGNELRIRVRAEETAEAMEEVQRHPRRRRLSGHAYMVDVEPGRWRIRLKLPDGRDLTLDADGDIASQLKGAVDKAVEIEAIEELEGDQVAARTAVALHLLPTSGQGSDKPPKPIHELAQEQGLADIRPEYERLATLIWQTEADVEEFQRYLQQIRQVPTL